MFRPTLTKRLVPPEPSHPSLLSISYCLFNKGPPITQGHILEKGNDDRQAEAANQGAAAKRIVVFKRHLRFRRNQTMLLDKLAASRIDPNGRRILEQGKASSELSKIRLVGRKVQLAGFRMEAKRMRPWTGLIRGTRTRSLGATKGATKGILMTSKDERSTSVSLFSLPIACIANIN